MSLRTYGASTAAAGGCSPSNVRSVPIMCATLSFTDQPGSSVGASHALSSRTRHRSWIDAHTDDNNSIGSLTLRPYIHGASIEPHIGGLVSSGRCNELGELLGWFHPVEGLSRAPVELCGDGVEVFLAVPGEWCAFGEVLAEQPVGVLVRAALPG